MKIQKEKLTIIVPYRDREKQLNRFIPYMEKYFKNLNIEYEIVIVEQKDNKPFNRGRLLNIGFKESNRWYAYVCFHDVDLLPEEGVDYSYCSKPTHLATGLSDNNYELSFPDYFGGVTMFNRDDFNHINGFSNEYWGWGFEDDDLLFRCDSKGLSLDRMWVGDDIIHEIHYLEFDGTKDYVEIPIEGFPFRDFDTDFTLSVRSLPYNPYLNKKNDFDDYFIISRPGYHTGISYTSFKRFKFEYWQSEDKSVSSMPDIIGQQWSHLVMSVDVKNQIISFYKDGKFLEKQSISKGIFNYKDKPFYLGVGNPTLYEKSNWFKGAISEVAIWDTYLNESEVTSLYKKSIEKTPVQNFDNYKSCESLLCYFDFKYMSKDKVIDCSGNDNHGIRYGGLKKVEQRNFGSNIRIPNRRNSKFTTLSHKGNAWAADGLKWVHKETRQNQIKYFNESKDGKLDINIDGLNTLRYKVVDEKLINNKHKMISVV